jgi:hypothetical protein
MSTQAASPYQQRRVALAKLLAASMMGLRGDATGANLPEDLWERLLPKADAVFFIVSDIDRGEAASKMETQSYRGPG